MPGMKVLVLGEQPTVRDALAATLRQVGRDPLFLQAGDASRARALLDVHADLALLVLNLLTAEDPGWHLLTKCQRKRSNVPIIVVSAPEDAALARMAFSEGALGYVPKSANQRVLFSAIRMVLDGELYVPPLLLDGTDLAKPTPSTRPGGLHQLTDRQIEILRLLGEGASNKHIARHLDIAEKTVKAHIGAIFKGLGVVNRLQAVSVARWAGLIPDATPGRESSAGRPSR